MWLGGELREEPGLALPWEGKEAEEGFAQHLPAPEHVPCRAHAAARPSTYRATKLTEFYCVRGH